MAADRTGEATAYSPSLGYQCFPWAPSQVLRPKGTLVRRGWLPDYRDADFMSIPADLAVETVSPNDRPGDVTFHVREYLAAGFGVVWVVDPTNKTVAMYRGLEATPIILGIDDVITAEPALSAFRCRVAEFFE